MICKKCANMFDDSLSSCPECGTPVFNSDPAQEQKDKKAPFILSIPEEEIEKPIIIKAEKAKNEKAEEEKAEDEQAELPEASSDASQEDGEAEEAEEEAAGKETEKVPEAPQIVRRARAVPAQVRAVPEKKEPQKKPDTVGDRAAATLIVSIVCILACVMTVLTFVSVKSDVFKSDGDVVKTVAMSSLSSEQKGELESWFSKVGVICEDGISSSQNAEYVLRLIRPKDDNGIYSTVYGKAEITADAPDPAHRYANENGDYSYYKLNGDKVDALIDALGATPNHTVNTPDFYYFGGSYYFRDKSYKKTKLYLADVKSSKRIMDGSYYIECSFLDKNDFSSDEKKSYAIVESLEGVDGIAYKVKKLTDTPVFDANGAATKQDQAYEMKVHTVEKKAKDGTVYHRYIIEYPEFAGNTEAEKTANQLFGDLINVYDADGGSAEKAYKRFIKNGGDKNELPLVTHITSKVTYSDGRYLSFIEQTAEYIPPSMPQQQAEGESNSTEAAQTEENLPVTLPKLTVEGYNLDTETGDFVTKDAIIGKDYQNISELLYRIYKGYSYDDLKLKFKANLGQDALSEETSTETDSASAQDIPEDTEGLGLRIYESASVLTEKGYMFCFVTEEGYAAEIIVPADIEGLYVIELNK